MKEEGRVISYNGFEGVIANESGTYALLKDNVYREDQKIIRRGHLVEFEPVSYTNNFGSFSMAKSVRVLNRSNEKNTYVEKKKILSKKRKIK